MGWHSDIPILDKGNPLNSPCTCTFFENVKNAPILLKFCVQKQLIKCINLWKFEQNRTIFGRFNGSERTRARSKMLRFGSNFVCKYNLVKGFTTQNLSQIGALLSVLAHRWRHLLPFLCIKMLGVFLNRQKCSDLAQILCAETTHEMY